MKQIILFFILSVSILAQTKDSMGVVWTEADDADFYGTIVYADSMVNPPTTARDTILAGTEILEWLPNKTGLWYVGAKSLDNSGNVSIMSNIDTATIFETAAGSYTTADLELEYLYSTLTNGDIISDEWVDNIASFPLTTVGSDPNKNDTAVVFDTDDYLLDGTPPFTASGALSLELIIFITDTVTEQGILAYGNGNSLSIDLKSSYLCANYYDGVGERQGDVYSTPVYNKWVQIFAVSDGTNDPKIYVDGVLQTNHAGVNAASVAVDSRVIIGYNGGSIAGNAPVRLWRVYSAAKTLGEIQANHTWAQSQGLVP